MSDRVLGAIGAMTVFAATIWSLAGGEPLAVTALVAIGLGLVVADAVVWRGADRDLAAPPDAGLPSAPWGFLAGPVAASGLVAGAAAGVPLVMIASGLLLVVSLAGAFVRFPVGALPMRPVTRARRIRHFARAHGVEIGERIPGYLVHLGEGASRLFVFAPDGEWGDAVLRHEDVPTVLALARVDLVDPVDPEAGRRLAIGPRFWTSMNLSW